MQRKKGRHVPIPAQKPVHPIPTGATSRVPPPFARKMAKPTPPPKEETKVPANVEEALKAAKPPAPPKKAAKKAPKKAEAKKPEAKKPEAKKPEAKKPEVVEVEMVEVVEVEVVKEEPPAPKKEAKKAKKAEPKVWLEWDEIKGMGWEPAREWLNQHHGIKGTSWKELRTEYLAAKKG